METGREKNGEGQREGIFKLANHCVSAIYKLFLRKMSDLWTSFVLYSFGTRCSSHSFFLPSDSLEVKPLDFARIGEFFISHSLCSTSVKNRVNRRLAYSDCFKFLH